MSPVRKAKTYVRYKKQRRRRICVAYKGWTRTETEEHQQPWKCLTGLFFVLRVRAFCIALVIAKSYKSSITSSPCLVAGFLSWKKKLHSQGKRVSKTIFFWVLQQKRNVMWWSPFKWTFFIPVNSVADPWAKVSKSKLLRYDWEEFFSFFFARPTTCNMLRWVLQVHYLCIMLSGGSQSLRIILWLVAGAKSVHMIVVRHIHDMTCNIEVIFLVCFYKMQFFKLE